jgi:hypothetical protein
MVHAGVAMPCLGVKPYKNEVVGRAQATRGMPTRPPGDRSRESPRAINKRDVSMWPATGGIPARRDARMGMFSFRPANAGA